MVNRHETELAYIQASFRGFKPSKGYIWMIAGEIIESKNTFENSKPLKSKNATLKQKTIKLSLS